MSMGATFLREDGTSFVIDFIESYEVIDTVGVPLHPVEEQGDLANHVQVEPTVIRLRANHNEYPEGPKKGDSSTGERRLQEAKENLRGIIGQAVTIIVDRGRFESFTLTAFPHSVAVERIFDFDGLTFQKLEIAYAKAAILPAIARGNPSTDVGDLPSEEAPFEPDDVSLLERTVRDPLGGARALGAVIGL